MGVKLAMGAGEQRTVKAGSGPLEIAPQIYWVGGEDVQKYI